MSAELHAPVVWHRSKCPWEDASESLLLIGAYYVEDISFSQ